nr:hypothetical protein [Gemmatimonadales bacterium]NIN50345.1 hypothetical protein [Gemmatimonadales bacterium]NIP07809.1 hypothetical protein [Gemmatimonadales bacterium]NIS65774.1 hypothetical protein [Gemmatimonadales bacterium]
MESFVILVLIAVAGLGISAAAQAGKRKPVKDAWRAAASALQLGLKPGDFFTYPEMHGEMHGHSVRVSIFTKGEESERHTRYRIILRSSLGVGLRIRERTALSGIQRLFRGKELSFDELEDRLVIRATASDAVVSMLGPLRRHTLRDFYAFFPDAVIDDTTITWENAGVDDTRDRIVENVRGLVKMADELEHWSREPEPRPLSEGDETTAAIAQTAVEPKRLPASIRVTDASESERAPSLSMDELLDPGWRPPRQPEVDETDMSEEERVEADAVIQEPKPA